MMDAGFSLPTPLPAWLRTPALMRVMDVLGAGNALMVGGCVRAAVLGEETPTGGLDIDIATKHAPFQVTGILEKAGMRVVPTGVAHGTVTAVTGGQRFEITTLRRDVSTDGRRAEVAFTDDWAQDAQRRDFTMNTLFMDVDGRIYDPTGMGVADLQNGVVRFVGDADTRIAEDYLRILRFFRFHARYGKGEPDAMGLHACLRAKFHIAKLSRERITQEYVKLLPARGAAAVLDMLRVYDILPDLINPDFNQGVYARLADITHAYPEYFDFKLLFAYSVWRNKADIQLSFLARYFVLSGVYKLYLERLLEAYSYHTDLFIKKVYLFGKDAALGAEVLLRVINGKADDIEAFMAGVAPVLLAPVPALPVNGHDVARVTGLAQGKVLGEVLKTVEQWWLDDGLRAGREETMLKIRDLAKEQATR